MLTSNPITFTQGSGICAGNYFITESYIEATTSYVRVNAVAQSANTTRTDYTYQAIITVYYR